MTSLLTILPQSASRALGHLHETLGQGAHWTLALWARRVCGSVSSPMFYRDSAYLVAVALLDDRRVLPCRCAARSRT